MIFENDDHLLQNENIRQNWRFCKIFAFTIEAHIIRKLIMTIYFRNKLSFFSELTTKLLQKPIVIFPKIDN